MKKKNKDLTPTEQVYVVGGREFLIKELTDAKKTSTEPTKETIDDLFLKATVLPFGCEFTFITKKDSSLLSKTAKLLTRQGYMAGIDCDALEVRSPVFTTVEECIVFYRKIEAICIENGLSSKIGDKDTGGLHIRIDVPGKNDAEVRKNMCSIIDLHMSDSKIKHLTFLLNEPGDFLNGMPLCVNTAFATKFDFFKEIMKGGVKMHEAAKDKCREVILRELWHNKNYAIAPDMTTSVPCIEYRCFDSPKNEVDLVLRLKIAHIIHSAGIRSDNRSLDTYVLPACVSSLLKDEIEQHAKWMKRLESDYKKGVITEEYEGELSMEDAGAIIDLWKGMRWEVLR